ncbi:MAG: T9SS type A sorting domain-containing protein [Bacteroidales bacterium]|nr:T9SS type A sorting domain-containing protein [Bacteroidales bacterium]
METKIRLQGMKITRMFNQGLMPKRRNRFSAKTNHEIPAISRLFASVSLRSALQLQFLFLMVYFPFASTVNAQEQKFSQSEILGEIAPGFEKKAGSADEQRTFGDFTEVSPLDSLFVTPEDEDFWVVTTAPADYDNDGDLDIAVLGYYVVYNVSVEDRLILIRNNGPVDSTQWGFSYFYLPLDSLTTGLSDLSWGDLDGDGDLDLAIGTDGRTEIYRNDAGSIALIETVLPAYWEENDQADFDLRSITWADYDNDADMDLLIPSVYDDSTYSYSTALMRNDGANGPNGWNFTRLDSVFAPTIHAQSFWADFDGDQDLDLLLVNIDPLTENGFIRRYRNDGNGVFTGEDILGSLTVEHGEAQWGDYDGDGDLDILVAGNIRELDSTYTPLALRIYRNDNDSFVPVEVIADPYSEGWFDFTAATWADYDSDGDMDILLAGNYNSGSQIEGRARIYSNTNGIFTNSGNELPAPRASGDRGGTFSWLDIDGEGDLDYFIAGQYFVPEGNGLVESQIHIYRNDAASQNLAPSNPSGLEVNEQGENTVLLSWNASTDDFTPEAALTYDLDLFRNHVPVTIPTRLPEPGKVSAVTEWLLTGLQDGEYEWTLRAVDAAYMGSQITMGAFSVGEQTAIGQIGEVSEKYSLGQNYPNPFNSGTNIHFSLPDREFVIIRVYDVLGTEIQTLVNKEYERGQFDIEFQADELASGIYFYSITAGDYHKMKKMQRY